MVKKIIFISLAVLLVGCALFLFFGCSSVNGLSWTQVWGIQGAYINSSSRKDLFSYSDIRIEKYLGTYNGNIAVRIRNVGVDYLDDIEGLPTELIIDGVYIGKEDAQVSFMLYVPSEKDAKDKLVGISVAYEKGLLTKADLESIAEMEAKAQKSE